MNDIWLIVVIVLVIVVIALVPDILKFFRGRGQPKS